MMVGLISCETLILLPLLISPSLAESLGGEKEAFELSPFIPSSASYRQDVCGRFNQFRSGEIELKNALSGLALRPIINPYHGFFHYSRETGINSTYAGLIGDLMDVLASRANFTWRDSFAVIRLPHDDLSSISWTDYLVWSVEHFDISLAKWDHTVTRMGKGVAFVEPWHDGSLILIDRRPMPREVNSIVLTNWLLPFDSLVWVLIITTVFASALVYQLLEYMNDEREERTMFQWFSDNLYLSSLNFSQNFEYAPNSLAGRIFGVSMSIWALVITATYTANLASLLVQQNTQVHVVDSIEKAIVAKWPVCTFAGSNADQVIQRRYEQAIRIPMATELQMFQALRKGECGLAVVSKDNWLTYASNQLYNPECALEWVGREIMTIQSGFAVKADSGNLCSSLIRDVFNFHLAEISDEGILDELWRKHRAVIETVNCHDQLSPDDGLSERRVLLSAPSFANNPKRSKARFLKGGGSATTASASDSTGTTNDKANSSLTVESLLGTFVLHWSTMAVAILVSALSLLVEKSRKTKPQAVDYTLERVTYRGNGPIIGMPPRMNTFVMRKTDNVKKSSGSGKEEQHPAVNNQATTLGRNLHGSSSSGEGHDNHLGELQWRRDMECKLDRLLTLESKLERLLTLAEGRSKLHDVVNDELDDEWVDEQAVTWT
ncbi:receptor subunit 1 [Seminavis robusta]|uniref:Receptor subunit 1 n=1 Tax=Seminavis robusta TaxID=568900 RepID=A0A9N8EVS2_9STRA|nr:receptor subunit 1 [Seminavis robusta]|eukprot:Sro1834_g300540.1 receptor subunit 1 (664) ;mRNA; r:12572-14759